MAAGQNLGLHKSTLSKLRVSSTDHTYEVILSNTNFSAYINNLFLASVSYLPSAGLVGEIESKTRPFTQHNFNFINEERENES